MNAPSPLPRWFWLLPLVAAVTWWPWSPYWKSDDFLMLHHASDVARVLADFVGPQYGATDIWFFYRPLMTASFWLELQLGGGPSPLLSHATNALVHAGSALLAALLWRRWLGNGRGFLAGLVWAAMPGHQGAITWAVGRSDGHGTFWSLLALLLFLRQRERTDAGQRSRHWPCLLAMAAALATKEIAFVLAPVATLLAFYRAPDLPLPRRTTNALRSAAPLWILFVVYLAWRCTVLGRLGGYANMQFDAAPMLVGFLHVVGNLLVPLRWIGQQDAARWLGLTPDLVAWLAAVPLLAALAWYLARPHRWPALLGALVLFVGACVPMTPFFADSGNPLNLRYYCLPTVALAGLLAAPPRTIALLLLLTWLGPLFAVRGEVHAADQETRTRHTALLQRAQAGAGEPLFVEGLPIVNATGTALMCHFGVDRMLTPPFTVAAHRLYPLRPVIAVPPRFSLDDAPTGGPAALPVGSTWWFRDSELLPGNAASPLPDLSITGDADGLVDLSSTRLATMEREKKGTVLSTDSPRTQVYRVTIFTALGYFACLCPEHAPDDSAHGALDLLQFFAGDRAVGVPPERSRIPPAMYGPGIDQYPMLGLMLASTHDLATDFPVLVEAGTLQGERFVATHRTRRLLTFRFDRGYPAWVRRALGLDR